MESGSTVVQYTAEGGGRVTVLRDFLPFNELGFSIRDGDSPPSHAEIKLAFARNIKKSSRHTRALTSLAYYFCLTKDTASNGCVVWSEDGTRVTIERVDGNLLAAVGDTKGLMAFMDAHSYGASAVSIVLLYL